MARGARPVKGHDGIFTIYSRPGSQNSGSLPTKGGMKAPKQKQARKRAIPPSRGSRRWAGVGEC